MAFNLIDEPWIPCVKPDATQVELGIRDTLLQAHNLRAIQGDSPIVTASLYRLLLAILQRVYMPDSPEAWGELWAQGAWDAASIDAYLDQWRHRFELFDDERPFYQAPDERVKSKSIISIIPDMASGNNATLFDHHTEAKGATLTAAAAARAVVTAQTFGLAGLSGIKQRFTDGSCARGALFLVEGDSLFETLALNLLPYSSLRPMETVENSPEDRPAWEMNDPFTPERQIPLGYFDYLTWQNRRILLEPEEGPAGIIVRNTTIGPALRLDNDVLDPMKHYRIDEKRGYLVLRFLPDRALWRDSAALLQLKSRTVRPPYTFEWLSVLVDEGLLAREKTYRYMALGMASSQAKVNFYRAEHMPLPLAYLHHEDTETLVGELGHALELAENTRNWLYKAAARMAQLFLAPDSDRSEGRQPDRNDVSQLVTHWAVMDDYWSQLELPFKTLVQALPVEHDSATAAWQQALKQAAEDALKRATSHLQQQPRAYKAVVKGEERLWYGLKQTLPALQ